MCLIEYIKSDLARRKEPTIKNFFLAYFSLNGGYFRFQVWLRIVHCLKKGKISKRIFAPFAYLIYHSLEYKYGIYVNTNIHIGKGLKIIHGGGIHLNCAEIGDNFTCYHGVTCGTRHDKDDIPTIGNSVSLYPNAVICGRIKLCDGTIVGANSYVDKDTPVDSLVIGQSSRIIQHREL